MVRSLSKIAHSECAVDRDATIKGAHDRHNGQRKEPRNEGSLYAHGYITLERHRPRGGNGQCPRAPGLGGRGGGARHLDPGPSAPNILYKIAH
jgi:hypothetical protein